MTWAAFPESVTVGAPFSLEFAGPVHPTACGRLDTATLSVEDGAIRLGARRSTFSALCAKQRISFYEARPISIDKPGSYRILTVDGRELGRLTASDSGGFSRMRTVGEGTVEEVAGCWLFGPGWIGGQRVFALEGVGEAVKAVGGSDRLVHVEGDLVGFTLCSWYGSRPRILVDTAWVTDRSVSDYY